MVLSEDPDDPNALAAAGWFEWNYGTAGTIRRHCAVRGARTRRRRSGSAPTLYVGHFFLGLILSTSMTTPKGGMVQFNNFLADHPPGSEIRSVATLCPGVAQLHEPLPPTLAA